MQGQGFEISWLNVVKLDTLVVHEQSTEISILAQKN